MDTYSNGISELKKRISAAADAAAGSIERAADALMAMPELGYKEHRSAKYVADYLSGLGLSVTTGLALTGVKAVLPGRNHDVKICVIGELDAVTTPSHPDADASTGAAHACGHNIQLATMLGTAEALVRSGAAAEFDGDVVFFAVPAEEFVELEYRKALRDKGAIKYLGGKQELLRLSEFDGIDIAMMAHAYAGETAAAVHIHGGSLGFQAKIIRFIGKEAHGSAPHRGINALNAAMAALMCIHAQRETFRDDDKVRIHPIITKGGDMVNIVPAEVVMETYVRAANAAAIADACAKVDRSVEGACHAIGAECEIRTIPGYLPLHQNDTLGEMFASNAQTAEPGCKVVRSVSMVGSTDMGDLTCLIPGIHPNVGGFRGNAHGPDFKAVDFNAACIMPAKAFAMTAADLLVDGAAAARKIKRDFVPALSRAEYFKYLDGNGGGGDVDGK